MLMMCWFYCIPFVNGLLYASGPLAIVFSLFVLKRGVRQSRAGLRQFAFLLMFAAVLKMSTADIYLLRDNLMCAFNRCDDTGFLRMVQAGGLVVLVLFSLFLLNLYRSFAKDRRQHEITPEQVHLSFWANLSVVLVVLLILWLAAPWAGYLTVGHVPQLFVQIPWQHLAMFDVVVLLIGFWKLEDCLWGYQSVMEKEKTKKQYRINVWTAKDTLWVSVVLFAITFAFSYASNDVLSASMPKGGGHLDLGIDKLDINDIGPGFQKPE